MPTIQNNIDQSQQIPSNNTEESTINISAEQPLLDSKNLQVNDSNNISNYVNQGYGVNPNGKTSIKFETGNFDKIQTLTIPLSKKLTLIEKTIIPIIEVALIELLGNNSLYKAKNFTATAELNTKGQAKVNVNCVYFIEKFIGTDVNKQSIMHDAKYILDRVNSLIQNIFWNKCEIDCSQGLVTIDFDL